MALSKSSKRSYSDTDSDSETSPSSFPRFIVLESLEEKPLAKLNPFVIEKTINGIVIPQTVKKLKDGNILVEIDKKSYADNLLKMKFFANLKIKTFAHNSLNTSKGVVRSSELSLCTLDEIKRYLQNQGVSDVKRISIKRNDEIIHTNTYIFTFDRSQVPKELKVGYNLLKVSPYIPLRCYNCQRFGHHESKCLKPPVCKKCGESGSDHIELTCTNPIKCTNCQGKHPSDSRNCMVWKREKEINQVKFTNNIPFPEARKIVQSQNNFPPKSYAQAATTNMEPKQHHSCQSCHTLLEKLSNLTPDTLPKFINDLKDSLLEDKPSKPSTSQPTVKSQPTQPPREVAKQVAPPQTTQTLHLLLGRAPGLLTGDFGKVLLLVRGSSWRKPTQKIDSPFWRMRSPWSVGHHHLPPHLPRLSTVGRALHRLLNLNGRKSINNHH